MRFISCFVRTVFFNLLGVILWFAIPPLAKFLLATGKGLALESKYKLWLGPVYVLSVFLAVPGLMIGLSIGYEYLPVIVFIAGFAVGIGVIIFNVVLKKKPEAVKKSCPKLFDRCMQRKQKLEELEDTGQSSKDKDSAKDDSVKDDPAKENQIKEDPVQEPPQKNPLAKITPLSASPEEEKEVGERGNFTTI